MKLEVVERIHLLNIIPAEGNIVTLRIANDLREALSFSEKELVEAKVKQGEDGRITWDPTAGVVKDVKVGDAAKDIIKGALKKLDEDKKLTVALVPLWDKFMA